MAKTKRVASLGASSSGPSAKKARSTNNNTTRSSVTVGASRRAAAAVKADPDDPSDLERLRQEFLDVFSNHEGGISNGDLKRKFGESKYLQLVPIINELTSSSRLVMSKVAGQDELHYTLVSDEMASKFSGLDVTARMIYQVIEKAGNLGIWTKDVRTQTNMQQQALNKIFKALESRRLIKPIKSVTAKAKKLYMAYNVTPAKEITGGPWYTELEFDHEFIIELRQFLMHCVRRVNGGRGVSIFTIRQKMMQANVSRVNLSLEDVQQLMQTLAFDYKVEQAGVNEEGEALFVEARRVTPMCDFKWWDVLSQDFHFRTVRFEDDVVLSAHEPHHHTS